MENRAAIKLTARGQVQGVGFRMTVKEQALKRQLTGWVKNVPSGEVEAEIYGEETKIAELLEWLEHESGFMITTLDTEMMDPTEVPETFIIKT